MLEPYSLQKGVSPAPFRTTSSPLLSVTLLGPSFLRSFLAAAAATLSAYILGLPRTRPHVHVPVIHFGQGAIACVDGDSKTGVCG